jgi:hypothetical protein
MGLTPEMITWIKEETIPRLKEEYEIMNSKEFVKDNDGIDMVWLSSSACNCELTTEDKKDWEEEIEDFGAAQVILNWVYDWLMTEEWG